MSDLRNIITMIKEFRDQRDWSEYHTPKDLAICLSVESAELLECFVWKKESDDVDMEKVRNELADVLYTAFLLADSYELDIPEIIKKKLIANEEKYPVELSKGSNKKYSEFDHDQPKKR